MFIFLDMMLNPKYVIKNADHFQNLSDNNIDRLASICLSKTLKKKELLFLEGSKGHSIYLCAKGTIRLYRTSESGQEVVVKIVKPGELFAEVVLFEKVRYPVTAVALENSVVYMLPKAQMLCLLEDTDFRNDFIANLMAKLRYLVGEIQSLESSDVETRFFRFFKKYYGDEKQIKVTISKKDIASAIGITPETLSRMLLRLKNENKIIWEGRLLKILKSR